MANAPAPSLRELARSLGLSHTTVSEALRESPRVKVETRQRVILAARAAGYRYNPLAGALMSEMRRSRTGTFRGVLAVVDFDGPDRRPATSARYHRELIRGASERAADIGFKAELIVMGNRGISAPRLDSILQSRGIRGVFLLPVIESPDLSKLDWTHYAGVYADYIIERPALHSVCSDHYRSMYIALNRLQALGYKRPGLVLQKQQDERLLFRWQAAFRSYQEHHDGFESIRPFIANEVTEENFSAWFTKNKPDVVLSHRAETIRWMEACGASVPRTHGFCCLNVMMNAEPCAGLDLQPRLLGARGVELLIAQLHRNEYGAPEIPSTTTVPGRWVDGPTLRTEPPK
ncbi:MAG TPA: LacI family DNA-binding transcriptional regulator [Opitutaceae bacterium]|nr:LacI family DNA-binding transcriptional regulator [Opitutaceae bacterium]